MKIALIAGIAITVAFCLSAFKLFPVQEYMKVSSRNLSYQESSGRAETLAHLVPSIISIVGIVPLGLILFGVYKGWKKKTIIFLVAVCLFSFLVSMRGPILYLVWKYYPSWQGMRYASRGMVLFAFAGSILAGAGLKEINEYVKNKSKKIALIHIVIILLTIISLLVLGKGPIRIGSDGKQYEYGNIDEMIKQNEVMQAISKMPGIFRMNVFETRGIDWGTEFYTVPLKLEPIFGYETAWLTEYMNEYLSLAYNDLPKFWGILNVKYITSKERINLTGFEMIGEYKPCSICFPSIPELAKAYGPYLFENKKFLPRAYIVNNGILVVGEKASAKDAMYSLMLHPAFDPSRSVIVLGKEKINQYDIGSLQRFSHVILTKGSVDGEDRILAEYKRKGGIILPDVLVGKNSISEEDVGRMFSTNSSFVPVADKNILTVNFDNKKIALEKEQSGFLVVSEQYSIYPGWGATVDGKPAEILRADGVISAVVLDNASKLTFEYKPKSLQLGVIISIIAAIAIAIYMIYFIYRNYEKKVQSNS
ncbi:MAG TPA: hypothetical protein VFF28_02090 [Candidatus Nanoarchaeia archaeon]|nr:hypothetical protein [Candidatus Nanoarchaeia archaeon]